MKEVPSGCIIIVDTMRARIQKWGNSLALRIPKSVAQEAGLVQGCEIDVKAHKGGLTIRPRKNKSYTLAQLLRGTDPRKSRPLVDWGPPQGREVW